MVDRAPTKPNRYAVYDDEHNFIRYEYHERADEPTEPGDALNKANLLPDAVATALGLTGNPQVGDALEKIKTLIDANTTLANSKVKTEIGSYVGTGTYGLANAKSLTFSQKPFLVSIWRSDSTSPVTTDFKAVTLDSVYSPYGGGYVVPVNTSRPNESYAKIVGNTLSWYYGYAGENEATLAGAQLNEAGITYKYAALLG